MKSKFRNFLNNPETVQIIIQYSTEYNINLNSKTNNGYTPFQLACENELSKVVEILLQVTFSLKSRQKNLLAVFGDVINTSSVL